MKVKRIYNEIYTNVVNGNIKKDTATNLINMIEEENNHEFAIVGMSATYPKSKDIDVFWKKIVNGMDMFDQFPQTRQKYLEEYNKRIGVKKENEKYVKGAYLSEIDKFDSNFFGIAPSDADLMDPCQRMFLENVYHTIEDSGYINCIKGSKTGVFVGFADDMRMSYSQIVKKLSPKSSRYAFTGNLHSIISSRISFFKDLKGPAIIIDSACSSSLVALHMACESIANGECEQALVGGVKINFYPMESDVKIGIESKDGKTRPFDNSSDGTGSGEGVASIMIKPLKSAIKEKDRIYAVIKGSSINQDGEAAGITAPNVESQISVLHNAWKNAGINPVDLDFIEAHGTATKLGDTIEIEALTEALSKYTNKKQICGITAIKSNIGHLYESSGITGVIKCALSLYHNMVPGICNFYSPNSNIEFEKTPFFVIKDSMKLEKKEKKHLCGISSFGFSGTNCHVVLEEAPHYKKKFIENEDEIFTISAKSKWSLIEYIKKYQSEIINNKSITLRELCYNTNCFKENFQYRIAFVVKSMEDLYGKLSSIIKNDYIEDSVYYGDKKIVLTPKDEYMSNELSISEYKALCKKADELIDNNETMDKIAKIFIDGADIDWEKYYNEKMPKISLPLYPFEKKSHWVKLDSNDIDNQKEDFYKIKDILHPLIEVLQADSIENDIYYTDFSVDKHFVLSDHKVMDLNVIPGATYLEFAVFIGRRYFGTNEICIKNLTFMLPFAVKENEHKIEKIIVNHSGNETIHFIVCSKNEFDEWVVHVTGDIERKEEKAANKYDIDRVIQSFSSEPIDIDQNAITKGFLYFKKRWLNLKKIYKNDKIAVGLLELDVDCVRDLEQYYLHPALIDMGINSLSLTLGKRYLPLSYEKVLVYGPTPKKFYSIIHFDKNKLSGETISFDVELVDEQGNVFIEAINYSMKKVHEFKRLLMHDNKYNEIVWEEKALPINMCEKNFFALIGNNEEFVNIIAETLAARNNNVKKYLVKLVKSNVDEIICNINNEGIKHIIIAIDKPYNIEMFYIVKSLLSNNVFTNIYILGYSDIKRHENEVLIDPYNYAVYTFGKSINKEGYGFIINSVDISDFNDINLAIDTVLLKENELSIVKKGKVYAEKVIKKNIEEIEFREGQIRDGGTYVITGGTGGVALEIAKEISRDNIVNIVLISRSYIEGENWGKLLNTETNIKKKRLFETIIEIEKNGSKVTYESCDVTDYNGLIETFDKIRKDYNSIDGVFHCAGIAGNGFIISKDEQTFNSVIKPKIDATINIYKALKKESYDFLVLFSSVAALMALPGQSDYSAANAFMDMFAHIHSNENVVSINWPAFEEVGMAVDNNSNKIQTLIKTIKPKNAMYIMRQIISRKISNVLVGEWNYSEEIFNLVRMNYSKEIMNDFLKQKNKINNKKSNKISVVLSGRNDSKYSKYEIDIANIWGSVLGYSELNINDSFYELGGDSILAVKLNNEINKKYGTNISISELFNYLTIRDLAEYLESKIEVNKENTILIPKNEDMEFYPASSGQRRMYFADQSIENQTLYNFPMIFELIGNVDKTRINDVLQKMVDRQGVLRTSLDVVDGNLVQKVEKHIDFILEENECEDSLLDEFIQNYLIRQFDMTVAPIFRANFIECTSGKKYLFLDIHHAIMDGYSMLVFFNDFFALYEKKELPELLIQFTDYAIWEENAYKNNLFYSQNEYWINQLSNFPEPLNLNTDFMRPNVQSSEGDVYDFVINSELCSKLIQLAKNRNVTLFPVLLAGFYIFIYKQTNQDDFIVGIPTAGRFDNSIENLIGMFFNILPMRIKLDPEKTVSELIKEVAGMVAKGIENEQYDYDYVLKKLNLKQNADRSILFDVLFKLEGFTKDVALCDVGTPKAEIKLDDLTLRSYPFKKNRAKHDLTLEILTREDTLECYFEYCTKLFKKETIERMARHLLNIYNNFTKNPSVKINEIDYLSATEESKLINEFNNTKAEYPEGKTLVDLFEAQVEKTPERIAVSFGGESITYRELNNRANKFAKELISKGVKADEIVGIMTDRCIEMIVGIYGIIKAGAAYMPIDRRYPSERIEYMLDNSGARILVAQYPEEAKGYNVEIMELPKGDNNTEEANPRAEINERNLAYIIYTSGTTGRPKGVMIEHRSIVNRLNWMQKAYPIGKDDVILQKTTYTFDVSVWEIIWWSLTGASVMMLPQGEEKDPEAIVKRIKEGNVTTIHFVPSMLNMFIKYVEMVGCYEEIKSLRTVFSSGEALKKNQVDVFYDEITKRNGTKLINLYGPTEAAVDVTYYDCSENHDSEIVYIGKPIDNIRLYILDKTGKPTAIGVAGELCISGIGLARGYVNNEKLTNDKFVENPYDCENRTYRTGDLARWTADGNIEYLGRIDNQVKIRGFRIELEEIEKVIMKVENIEAATVVARDGEEGKYICAYYVEKEKVRVRRIRKEIADNLPEYMMPAYFIKIDNIPVTANGKLDRKALPAPDINAARNEMVYEEPETEMQRKLASVWSEVLHIEKVGKNDNFFQLGGHSLNALDVQSRIEKIFGVKISVRDMFKVNTISLLEEYINNHKGHILEGIDCVDKKDYYEISSAQRRLLMINELNPDDTSYILSSAYKIHGNLNIEKVKDVFSILYNRHESLCTRFIKREGEYYQVIDKNKQPCINYQKCTLDEVDQRIQETIIPMDLMKSDMLQIFIYEISKNEFVMAINMHHIISDGVSVAILLNEFVMLYDGKRLPDLKVTYKDYSAWQKKYLYSKKMKEQENYWLDIYKDDIPVINFPFDYPKERKKSNNGARYFFKVCNDIAKRLYSLCKETETTPFMILFGTYCIFLQKYTSQDDFVVGIPSSGRTHDDIKNIIGMFINVLPIRTKLDINKSFREYLAEIKNLTLESMENQDYPYELLVNKLSIGGTDRQLVEIMFAMENVGDFTVNIDSMEIVEIPIKELASKYDLSLYAIEKDNEIQFIFEYCKDLFDEETIQRMSGNFVILLDNILDTIDEKIINLNYLSATEESKLINEFNNTKAEYPEGKTLVDLFEAQVEKTPERIAVSFGGESITYRELNNRANKFAKELISKGVKADEIVGIMTDRCIEMIVGIYGIIKAGAAYMPIDRRYPSERIEYMLDNSGARILVAQYPEEAKGYNVEIMELPKGDNNTEEANPRAEINERNLAYIIYTSGTTGRPKGVMIEHRSIVNRLNWMQKAYPIGKDDVILQKTTYTFDVSVWEIIWWSLTGASVMMLPQGEEKDPEAIVKRIKEGNVTTIHFVPSMLNMFIKYVEMVGCYEEIKSLRTVFSSGEALKKNQVDVFYDEITKRNGTKLINLYGPTEAAVDVTYYDCSENHDSEIVYIGKPIDNIRLYILDKTGKPTAIGVAGELCISGIGLARGYVNNEKLTNDKFVENPYDCENRTYRTGDLARWTADGNIEYLGRIDNQVKIRGFRIELEEIEKVIMKVENIEAATVVARDGEEGKYICAYYVEKEKVRVRRIRKEIADNLPEYMMPAYFIKIDNIPVTANGKLDRKALPAPDINAARNEMVYEEPETEMQRKLASVWSEVLHIEKVGKNDNFFQLGGHSLNGIMVASKIRTNIGLDISLKDIFKYKTLEELAALMERLELKDTYNISHVDNDSDIYPVTFEQLGIYLANSKTTNYNISFVSELTGTIDIKKLIESIDKIFERHDILKTSFIYNNGELVQKVNRGLKCLTQVINVNSEDDVNEIIRKFNTPFDLATAPLFKSLILILNETKVYLLFDIHHIIFDGYSIAYLMKECFLLYNNEKLPETKIQYNDYALWQRKFKQSEEYIKQEEYWLNVFSHPIEELKLPYDYSAEMKPEGDYISGELSRNQIFKLANETDTTGFMVCLTIYAVLLHKYTQQEMFVIGVPIIGRKNSDLEDQVGMFVKSIPCICSINPNNSFVDILKSIKKNVLEAFDNQDYAFGELQSKLGVDKKKQRGLFQTMMIMQNIEYPKIEFEDIKVNSYAIYNHGAKYPVELFIYDVDDTLKVELNYACNMFKRESIKTMFDDLVKIADIVTQDKEIKVEDIVIVDERLVETIKEEMDELQDEMNFDF